ncbi:receptor-like protein kinase FERONIA [Trifolium pratense]|uniref:receptor-like protein kinase FERONIA n=1 Tax=Trifolium pratense TaxID=57577 RepID=UPI001E690290|nr:receptor-like protein kinase FERONIA [Trifolium pratense]
MATSINKNFLTKLTILSFIWLLVPLVANSYNPIYNLAVTCGSSTNTTALDNRIWIGDDDIHNSNLFTFIEPKTTNPSLKLPPNSLSNIQIPFTMARVSLSNFTYSISSITTSPVFLRLHFHPTTYQAFEPSNAIFSVVVNNNLTLLENFNPSLWIRNDEDRITKEYCIQIKPNENLLNITFIPSNINQSNVYYAFINGIEVVSMPPFLYYSDLSDLNYQIRSVDTDTTDYKIQNDKALEMVYRVNVGDNQVPPSNDTGMFRDWKNDFPLYLEKEYPLSDPVDFGDHLNFVNNTIPNYTAPEAVYFTARSYGMNVTEDYNVTWNFEVDNAFTYTVRLHFCEFDMAIKNQRDRVFRIFIANTLAEEFADVIRWSGDNRVPVHKDYAVPMYSQEGISQIERVNLSIKLQRLPAEYTLYSDVLLNGIEIFKINDKNNNLFGSNPKPINLSSKEIDSHSPNKQFKMSTIIILVVVAVTCLMLAYVIGIKKIVQRRKRSKSLVEMEDISWKKKKEGSSSLPSHLCRYFTIAEIKAATNNFDDIFIIGVGGFGNVYKGYIDGVTPVAIKRLKPGSQQGVNEFMNEIELLSQLRHIHLVSLIGYCNEGAEMILVYDFMQRGTLTEYLYGSDNEPLTWKQRLEILLGAARGLHYLHAGAKHNIIHRDVKSTNILLDEKWVAKVSDFGLSKMGPSGMSMTHITTIVKGSLGYLDPEYYMRQRLTLKSDVYSFGVVLLEVLCARPPLIRSLDKKKASLAVWFQRCYNEGVVIEEMVDPFIKDSITDECFKCYCQMVLSCLHEDGNQRLSMSDVVGALEFALQLNMSEEDSKFGEIKEKSEQRVKLSEFTIDDASDSQFTSSGDDYDESHTSKVSSISATTEDQPLFSATIFSENGNPRAR